MLDQIQIQSQLIKQLLITWIGNDEFYHFPEKLIKQLLIKKHINSMRISKAIKERIGTIVRYHGNKGSESPYFSFGAELK